MTEAELQAAVIDLAHTFKWRVAHFRPAMNERGQWRTAVAGDGKGFPDLVMVRDGRLLFVELKSDKGRVTLEQEDWLRDLSETHAFIVVWRPQHWSNGQIEKILR